MTTETKLIITACAFCHQIRNHESIWINPDQTAKLIAEYVYGKFGYSYTYCRPCTEEHLPNMKNIAQNERDREQSGYYSQSLSDDQEKVLKLLTVIGIFLTDD